MIYSTWNQGAGAYDYWRTSTPQQTVNVEAPGHLVSRTLGSTVDQAAWPLPGDAVLFGRGTYPQGRIATRLNGSALGDAGAGSLSPVMLAALAAVAWVVMHKRKRKP